MTRRTLLALTATRVISRAQSAGDTIGAARDMAYQGLELLSSRASKDEIKRAVGFFTRALDQDPNFGDACYYRQLCLRKLEPQHNVERDLKKAEQYSSEALVVKRDPFTLAVPKIYDKLPTIGQKWALVVGVSNFQPETGAERLPAAANDAKAFADFLRDSTGGRFPGNQVFLLTDEAATTVAVKARLNEIARKAKPEDLVVVFMATHGSARSSDLRQVNYVFTYDTNVTGQDHIFATALPMVEISGIVASRCLAQRTVVILDTCHSGATAYGQAVSSVDMDRLRDGAGRYILSSCEADQVAYEDGEHGYFTASLIEQLRVRKGCIRLKDLFARVQSQVRERVEKKLQKTQTPVMASSDNSAEIILGTETGASSEGCLG